MKKVFAILFIVSLLFLCRIAQAGNTDGDCTITTPSGDATVSGTVHFHVTTTTSSNHLGLAIAASYDGTSIAGTTSPTPTLDYDWDTTTVAVGVYYVRAASVTSVDTITGYPRITLTVQRAVVDTTPPVVTITSPANGEYVVGSTEVKASATDNSGVVEFDVCLQNSACVNNTTGALVDYVWDMSSMINQGYEIEATAQDAANNTGVAKVTVQLHNPPQSENDADGDGVPDANDRCPNTPHGTSVASDGCPDADKDGVADDKDSCPDTPLGSIVDSLGCAVTGSGSGTGDGVGTSTGTGTYDGQGTEQVVLKGDRSYGDGIDSIPLSETIPGKGQNDTKDMTWLDDIIAIITNHPLIAIIKNSGIHTSGEVCEITGTLYGKTLYFSFCELTTYMDSMGYFVFACSTIYSFMIIFKKG